MVTTKLKFNEKEYDCILGLGFLGEVQEILNLDYNTLLEKYEKFPFKYVPLLMFHSIRWAKELEEKEIDFTLKDLLGWIEDEGGLTNKQMIKFSNAFVKSLTKDVPKEEEIEEEGKSKKK